MIYKFDHGVDLDWMAMPLTCANGGVYHRRRPVSEAHRNVPSSLVKCLVVWEGR